MTVSTTTSVRGRASAPSGATAASGVSIKWIRLDDLFGLYNYVIPGSGQTLSRTPILYGENGLGKTNILRILFHLLSPAGDAGHRTALGSIKFRRAEVGLSNAVTVRAIRDEGRLEGAMRLEVAREGSNELLGAWDWYPKDAPEREASQRWLSYLDQAAAQRLMHSAPATAATKRELEGFFVNFLTKESDPLVGEVPFLNALKNNVPPVYFLTAERTLSSDHVGRRYAPMPPEARRMLPEEMVARGREHALNDSISLASRRFSELGIYAARNGSASTHTIYRDLIRRLASRRSKKAPRTAQAVQELTDRLLTLSSRYSLYAKYGLTPRLDGQSLVGLLENVRPNERSVALEVLRPYVESLTELARDLDAAYGIIDTFVTTVNGFLYDKTLEFAVVEGMVVRNRLGEVLQPKDLSSGEQQLLLLFCHIALAHTEGGIFIIDEPEISLNIKWQRRLVDALLQLDATKNLQFILASHSLEILTKHREGVVPLHEAVNA